MRHFKTLLLISWLFSVPAFARQDTAACGTTRETPRETVFLHRQSIRSQAAKRLMRAPVSTAAPSVSRDAGNIAIIEDSDGAVARQNQFNLDGTTVKFTPSRPDTTRYRFVVGEGGYDEAAASAGTAVQGLGDDDTRQVDLPFAFPFFGISHRTVFLNSDGNLTFTAGDFASTDRSLGRVTAGPPRIAPLFDDLDPTRGSGTLRVLAESRRFVVTWRAVPEWVESGTGSPQTFQLALYPDGRIEFAYSRVTAARAVVGIAPGNLQGSTSVVSFRNDPSGEYAAAVVERFTDRLEMDIVAIAQKFYQTHEDSYDYLAIFNNMDIGAGGSALALEVTVRNSRLGYGDQAIDIGREFGSASRLQAVLNLGHLAQYPRDPNAVVPARRTAGDTPLTVIGHEAGHLFLAFASARERSDPLARPMLGAQRAHWSFLFNSEASLLEGERILDRGEGASPRFITTDTVQGFSPLDQYLMGLRPASEVPPTFYVAGPPAYLAQQHPIRNYSFDGQRVDVTVEDVVRAEGRRTPDHTVSQRRFRFAFILLVAQGREPSAEQLAQLDTYRSEFENFFARATDNRATADTTLRRSLKLSAFPAVGVLEGAGITASVAVAAPVSVPLPVELRVSGSNIGVPASITIPAGARSVNFRIEGLRAGVAELSAAPRDGGYEAAVGRVQVSPPSAVRVQAVSGDLQTAPSGLPLPEPVVVRVTDDNLLPYPGVTLRAAATGGTLNSASAVTDESGSASIRWTLGPAEHNQLRVAVDGSPSSLVVNAGSGVALPAAVVNSASYAPGLTPGAFGTLSGVNLTRGDSATARTWPWPETLGGVRVELNGRSLPLLFAADRQVNFYVPDDVAPGQALFTVHPASGSPVSIPVTVHDVSPGIFLAGSNGFGAILKAGTAEGTEERPVGAGDYVEIYCTGLGPFRESGNPRQTVYQPVVYIGGLASVVVYSGPTGIPGLYQINAEVPFGIGTGAQPLSIRVGDFSSNEVKIGIR